MNILYTELWIILTHKKFIYRVKGSPFINLYANTTCNELKISITFQSEI